MYCYQCQETAKNKGCNVMGVCGKNDEVANLQDCLVYALKGLSIIAVEARKKGINDEMINYFTAKGLFTTLTNVNFDGDVIFQRIKEAIHYRDELKKKAIVGSNHDAATFNVEDKKHAYEKGSRVGVMAYENEDIRSLTQTLIYGLKGIAAYADHAYILGGKNDEILKFCQEALAATVDNSLDGNALTGLVLQSGKFAVDAMALLDKMNTEKYGNPEITNANFNKVVAGPGILVSGHDLLDFEELLKQTEGTGVNIYTHGEMLPANAYPQFKKFKHLIGNYGSSWFNQQKEFEQFKGAILMTTNCMQKPKDTYKDKIFTSGLVGWPEIAHIGDRSSGGKKDFSKLIAKAKEAGSLTPQEGKTIPIGFAHNQVMAVAPKVIEAIKAGAIKRFVVMAGCDGRHKEREYFTEVAKKLPKEAVILTAGCAKYRYNDLDLGDIGGIPRVLDAGQCNDSYSLAVIALKLKDAFGMKDVNELPLSFDIGWYEQKAVAVFLALLHLGFKKVRLGPTLPAFLSPNVAKLIVETFDVRGTTTVDADVEAIMSGK